jgi:DNA-binding NarL/FixJ family response regulator
MTSRPGSTAGRTVRVVLADDHALVREGTAELLERAGGIKVVGQAADGVEALRLVQALRPDVLLLDLAMPGLDGLEVARRARQSAPQTAIVALSAHDEDAPYPGHARSRANGCLSKSSRGSKSWTRYAAAAGRDVFSAPSARPSPDGPWAPMP